MSVVVILLVDKVNGTQLIMAIRSIYLESISQEFYEDRLEKLVQ